MVTTHDTPDCIELDCDQQDCIELGCLWDRWPETCRYGHRHIVRICTRCLHPPQDWDEDPCGPDQVDDGTAPADGWPAGCRAAAGETTVYESGAALLAWMDTLVSDTDADGSGVA